MESDPISYAIVLYKKGYLVGPKVCVCGNKCFNIYKDLKYKTNQCSFSCNNYKCKRKFPITINSFFQNFPNQNIRLISEIMKCFLIREFNAAKAYKYINNELKLFVSDKLIRKVFTEMRKIICKYLKIEYQSKPLGEKDAEKYFSVDESLINHYKGKKVWLLGISDNLSKDFRIEASYY